MKMKSFTLNIAVAAVFIFLAGCHTTINWNLPQGFNSKHSTDRILIQIEPAAVSGTHRIDPAIVKKLNTFLYDKFSSSARFVVLTNFKGDLSGTQNKFWKISPILTYHRKKGKNNSIYYCQTSISCQLLDLETGAHSNNGADDIPISKYCPRPIIVPRVWGQEHFNLTGIDVDTMFDESFNLVWKELEKKIAEKFPVNAKVMTVQSTGSDTKLVINAGTANGLRNSDLFKVYAVKNNIVTVVATAEGLVGKSNSTLTIKDWNMDDVNVRSVYRPQMENNQADNLYVVAESPLLR